MSLATRCPDCKTLNPTTAAQLQAQNGHLTCGHCGNLFSGIDHLTPADEDSWTSGQGEDPEKDSEAPPEPVTIQTSAKAKLLQRIGKPFRFLTRRMDNWPRFARRWTLILGALLLLQLVWWQRLAIAVTLPFLSPALSAWSESVGTDMAGAASSRLKILASSLKSSQENRLELEVRVRNGASTPSRWPGLELRLLDSKRETVTSITLRVTDYAVSGTDHPGRTLKPGEDAEIIAWIDTSVLNGQPLELPVTGFKVSIVDSAPPRDHPAPDNHH